MRRVLTLVALLLFAGPLTAQEVIENPGPEAEVQIQQMDVQAAPDVEIIGDTEVQLQESSEIEAAPAMQPDQRQWWWLVIGIVVAGVILAVLL